MDKKDSFQREENPFENEGVELEWINSVENETGRTRDKEIYPRLRQWIAEVKPKILLEIGAGQGICSDHIEIGSNLSYIGLEPSVPLVQRAKELYENKSRNFIVGNAYSLPFKNFSIDAVFSVNVWFHLENIDKAAAEMGRVLKDDGKFLIVTASEIGYHLWDCSYAYYKKEGIKIEGKLTLPSGDLSRHITYLHPQDKIMKSLNEYGLRVDKVETFDTVIRKDMFQVIYGHKNV